MLHLSFTQQLCHVAKYHYTDSAANDNSFGTISEHEQQALKHGKRVMEGSKNTATSYKALLDLAQTVFDKV